MFLSVEKILMQLLCALRTDTSGLEKLGFLRSSIALPAILHQRKFQSFLHITIISAVYYSQDY